MYDLRVIRDPLLKKIANLLPQHLLQVWSFAENTLISSEIVEIDYRMSVTLVDTGIS